MRIDLPKDRPQFKGRLADGGALILSPILGTDLEFFRGAFGELSTASRAARFGHGIGSLTDRELDYLTDVDQRKHVAWGAVVDGHVAGVGRYVVSDSDGPAEIAITVLDEYQQRGVGRALLNSLFAVARSDEVEEFWFEAQADNVAVRGLLGDLDFGTQTVEGSFTGRVRIVDLGPAEDEAELVSVINGVRD